MWSITRPTVQNGGTATKSVCIRRPAVSSGYSRLRSRAARSAAGTCAEDLLLGRLAEVLEQIGGVVGLELGDGLGQHRPSAASRSSWSRTVSSSSDSTSEGNALPRTPIRRRRASGSSSSMRSATSGALSSWASSRTRSPLPSSSASRMGRASSAAVCTAGPGSGRFAVSSCMRLFRCRRAWRSSMRVWPA